jgi:hypothetical protein
VTRVRFHRALYDGKQVDAALKQLDAYATFARSEEADHWVVDVTATSEKRERRVAGELMNLALGKTIEART